MKQIGREGLLKHEEIASEARLDQTRTAFELTRSRVDAARAGLRCLVLVPEGKIALGKLAAIVAHEINNPVNGIINYAQLILDAPDTPEASADHAREIVSEAQRVTNIVSDLLTFARRDRVDVEIERSRGGSDEVERVVTGADPYAELGREQLENVE